MEQAIQNRIPLTRIQRLIGRLMLEAKQTAPYFYLDASADITDLVACRKALCKATHVRVTTNDYFFCAVARAIKRFPLMAGRLDPTGRFIDIAPQVGVGFAVAAPQGLVVPVLKDIGDASLVEIAQMSDALLKKARSNRLMPDDFYGENVVLTALGMYGVRQFYAIAPPGATGILSIGNIHDTLVPCEQGFVVRKMMNLSLAADIRIVNEICAAQFLNCVVGQVESPQHFTQPAEAAAAAEILWTGD